MRLPIFSPITTRDGTLSQDGKTVNALAQKNVEGEFDVVKRPGLTVRNQLAGGYGQGMFTAPRLPSTVTSLVDPYVIIGDMLTNLNGGSPQTFVLNPQVVFSRFSFLNATIQQDGSFFSAIKNINQLWYIGNLFVSPGVYINGVTLITDANYPASTVVGVVYLDGTIYVMDPTGVIYGSGIYNPRVWSAANTIQTDRGIGKGVAISRHLNYVVAYGEVGIQFFYDAANPIPGSPLSPVQSATFGIGCASGYSIANIEDQTFFMSRGASVGRQICMITGTSLKVVSDPYVDRVLSLDDLTFISAYTIKILGHTLYVLNLSANSPTGKTLVYDLISGLWTVFTGVTPTSPFPGAFAVGNPQGSGQHLMLSQVTSKVYIFDPTVFADPEGPITVKVVTIAYDAGTMKPKSLPVMNIVADTVPANLLPDLTVAHYNDDYTTLQPARSIDLSTDRKQLRTCGSFRRRAWVITYTANTALRLKYLEIEPELKS